MTDDTGWRTMESAPRDGRLVQIGWKFPDDDEMQEHFTMRWDDYAMNGLFPGVAGLWTAPDSSFTWCEEYGDGPTHWRPQPPKEAP